MPDYEFTQYRRKQIAELRPYIEGEDVSHVSISPEDVKAGSPKRGDMIARNPKNHADQWLVARAYFLDNFEPLTTAEQAEPAPAADPAMSAREVLIAAVEALEKMGFVVLSRSEVDAIRDKALEEAAEIARKHRPSWLSPNTAHLRQKADSIAAAIRALKSKDR